MTALPTPSASERWLLRATILSARADDTRWDQQRTLLRSVASYDSRSQTWTIWIGELDLTTVNKLQTLFDAARTFGTEIHIEPVPVPTGWTGPAFTGNTDVAAVLTAKGNEGRPLGELPLA
ncbi:hypothetical protein [Streptomyces sp. NPDC006355]|uniref:hypothetical protein n=1 Tax=Streptomyces sp. NPDC006355 TaxID=3156758 RepID=UPI00339F9C39